mgnify:CR=1 FL=1
MRVLALSMMLISLVAAVKFENALKEDKMYILIGEEIFQVNLLQSPITLDLISILPLKMKLIQEDFSRINLKLKMQIETTLFPSMEPSIKCLKGDMLLYQGKELVIIKEPTTLENDKGDYIKIGNCENSEGFSNKIEKNKTILLWNSLNYENNEGKVKPYGNYNSILNYFTWKIFTFFCFLLI